MPGGEFQFTLSPKTGLIVGGVVLAVIIIGVIARPGLLVEQVTGIDEVESERIVPEIELQLKTMLEAELVQRRSQRVGEITIDAARAVPRTHHASRHDFWNSDQIRYVDLHLTVTVDGERIQALADVRVSGIANQMTLNSVELIQAPE